MSIQQITERETALANTLRMTTEALTLVTKERDRLSALADKWNLECDETREDNKRLAKELASMRDSGVELPKPYSDVYEGTSKFPVWIDWQIKDYGDRRAMAERERCAKVCEKIDEDSYPTTRKWPSDCAESIRKGEKS